MDRLFSPALCIRADGHGGGGGGGSDGGARPGQGAAKLVCKCC